MSVMVLDAGQNAEIDSGGFVYWLKGNFRIVRSPFPLGNERSLLCRNRVP